MGITVEQEGAASSAFDPAIWIRDLRKAGCDAVIDRAGVLWIHTTDIGSETIAPLMAQVNDWPGGKAAVRRALRDRERQRRRYG
jgi:DhnA family fructose-bisphosphate aldolase class Ia